MSLVPGIDVNIVEKTRLAPSVSYGNIMIIGPASWGPMRKVETFTSFTNLANMFQSGEVVDGASFCFLGGASTVLVYRIGDGSEAKATGVLEDSSGSAAIDVEAKYEGDKGNEIKLTVSDISGNKKLTVMMGNIKEVYDNGGDGYSSNSDLVEDVNEHSQLITMSVGTGGLVKDQTITLSGGANGDSGLSGSDYATAITDELENDDFDILVTPGIVDDSTQSTIVSAVENRYENDHKCTVYIGGVNKNEELSVIKSRTTMSSRFVLIAPGYMQYEGEEWDGSYIACVYAGLVASLKLNQAPTHKPFPVSTIWVNYDTDDKYYSEGEQEQLLFKSVTPLSKIGNIYGVVRSVTRTSDLTSPFYELSVRRIADYIETNVRNAMTPFIGQPNTERKRAIMKSIIDAMLEDYRRDEIITEYESEVVEGTSPDTVNITIVARPVFPINFIKITLVI